MPSTRRSVVGGSRSTWRCRRSHARGGLCRCRRGRCPRHHRIRCLGDERGEEAAMSSRCAGRRPRTTTTVMVDGEAQQVVLDERRARCSGSIAAPARMEHRRSPLSNCCRRALSRRSDFGTDAAAGDGELGCRSRRRHPRASPGTGRGFRLQPGGSSARAARLQAPGSRTVGSGHRCLRLPQGARPGRTRTQMAGRARPRLSCGWRCRRLSSITAWLESKSCGQSQPSGARPTRARRCPRRRAVEIKPMPRGRRS